jgi:hypothetical protein
VLQRAPLRLLLVVHFGQQIVTSVRPTVSELPSDIFFSELIDIAVAGSVTLFSSSSLHAPTSSFSSLSCSISEALIIIVALLLSCSIPLSSLFDGLLFIASSVTCCFLALLLNTCLIGGFDIPSGAI